MSRAIDTVEDEPQISPTIEDHVPQLVRTPSVEFRSVGRMPKRIPRWALVATAVVLAGTIVLSWWLYARPFESTDDAQIDGHINVVSSRITGTVVYVNPKVENNQNVEAGTLLVELDPNVYQSALDHARADLAAREAAARSAGLSVPITDANAFSQLRLAEAARDEAVAAVDSELASLAAAQLRV